MKLPHATTLLTAAALASSPAVGNDQTEALPEEPPLVYPLEHTGAGFPPPPLPEFGDLPEVAPLTDPLAWSDGTGRVTSFSDWARRRAEIKAEIEHYEIGPKPDRPEQIAARWEDGTLTVTVTVDGESLTLSSRVALPDGEGPFPAVIGIGRGPGSLPPDIFRDRGVAVVPFEFGQVMAHTQNRGREPINRLYPDLVHIGAYAAWPWGVSRLIDGLELVQDELPIDLGHLAVTGCSFAGKMALFAGAFDERIALTIAQEPGGGGAAAWRVSETLGRVEKLGATSRAWFKEDMFRFAGANVAKLPHDHHELMAMVAPRALLVLGNPDYQWLAEESGYVSCNAAREVWKTFGIGDRMGYSIVPGHGHCQLPAVQRPEVEAFVDKFLLGKTEVDTAEVTVSPYALVDHGRWTEWWGEGEPAFPERSREGIVTVALEAEDGAVGARWRLVEDGAASGGRFAEAVPGEQEIDTAPADAAGHIAWSFSVEEAGPYALYARVDGPTADDDSFWVEVDGGGFERHNGLQTSGWGWVKLDSVELASGAHTLTVGLREDGAKLDKLHISNDPYLPRDTGHTEGAGPE